jgi:hypothetical protein
MAYTRLPLADFKAKYAAFTTLTETPYAAWATEAEADITDRYGDQQQRATELLTAHYLALQGIGNGETGAIAVSGVTSFKSGTFSATISDKVAAERSRGLLSATLYGQQLELIQRRLFGGPRLAWTPPARVC